MDIEQIVDECHSLAEAMWCKLEQPDRDTKERDPLAILVLRSRKPTTTIASFQTGRKPTIF